MKERTVFDEYSAEYGRVRATLILSLKYLRRKINDAYILYLRKFGKVDEKAILFSSTPDYSDNSKALSEYLVANGYSNRYKIYWQVGDVDKFAALPEARYVIFLPRVISPKMSEMPFRTIKACMTSKFVLSTHANRIPKSMSLKGQRYIYLWHGCGYKDNNKEDRNGNLFDLCLVPGPLFVKTKSRFWNTEEKKILPVGYPRYDWLMNPSLKSKAVYREEKGEAHKTVIWMPTFRNPNHGNFKESGITQFPLLGTMSDWKETDEYCKERGIKLLIKLHPLQKMYDIDFNSLKYIQIIPQNYFDERDINMYEFIGQTDGLISDYSSIAVDYLLVDKPIAFTLDDFEMYKESRGFVFDNPLEYMPGHHLYVKEDLKLFLNDVAEGTDTYREKRKAMITDAIHISANYCKEVAQRIGL